MSGVKSEPVEVVTQSSVADSAQVIGGGAHGSEENILPWKSEDPAQASALLSLALLSQATLQPLSTSSWGQPL